MGQGTTRRSWWLWGILWAGMALGAWAGLHAAEPAVAPAASASAGATATESASADPDAALQRALDLERQRNWSAAIHAYEEALEQWPARTEFRHRLRLCEIHYRLVRRYQDQSFRTILLRLSRDRALELYDELLERIEANYVEPVTLEPLMRRGLDNLEVALRDPAFLKAHTTNPSPERVNWLRDRYRERRNRLVVPDRRTARAVAVWACDAAYQALRIPAAAIVLEFGFGACDALDDYTTYLTPDKLEDLYAVIDGNFVGLGVELKIDDAGLRLVGVIRGGPAWDAGLKPGDRITHVANQPIAGMSLEEAASRLQGAEGTAVTITVLRADGATRRLTLTRRPVEVESITQAKLVEPSLGVGYIQLTGFQKSSTEELQRAVATLQHQGMRFLVLDLRGNPGGLLNVAVDIADLFLDHGVIVTTRGRAADQSLVYRASGRAVWRMPMAVLIDHDSASASEILAGALKDHRRALVLGQRSYGKGSVQSIFNLKSVPAGLKLTTAKFYSPRDRPYSEQGVEPDVPVRSAAKPNPGRDGNPPEFGEPGRDPVLDIAIEQARRSLTRR